MSVALSSAPIVLAGLNLSQREDSGVTWHTGTVSGWGSPKGSLEVTQRPRAHGGWGGESWLAPRTVGLEGKVSAPSIELLSDAIDRLNAAVALDSVTLSVSEGAVTRSCSVRRNDEVIITWETDTTASWSAQVIAEDPRKYGDPLAVPDLYLPSSSGGRTFPYTFPYTIPATVISGTAGVINPGNIAAPIQMRLWGPCNGAAISHVGSDRQLILSESYALSATSWLDIDTGRRTVLENGQASRNGYITSRGWFDLEPGANTIGFNAATYNAAARLQIFARPAWL